MKRLAVLAIAASSLCSIAHADPIKILFVGNNYTFGRLDPVMSYNAANVHDLTAAFYAMGLLWPAGRRAGARAQTGHPRRRLRTQAGARRDARRLGDQ